MAKLIIDGLTLAQAKTLASWYEGQGEQDADVWFTERGVKTPYANVRRKGGYREIDGETVIMYCYTPE